MSDEDYAFAEDQQDDDTPETPQEDRKESNRSGYLERQNKKLAKELESLRTFKDQYDQEQAERKTADVFTELNIDPKRASWFRADNPEAEVSKEMVAQWAIGAGFLAQDDVEPVTRSGGFTPTTTPESAVLGSKRFTRAEWLQLSVDDPAEAQKVFKAGKVDLSDVRTGLGPER
jgi:hypothetical protein